jgi:histidinol-phosphatase
MPVILSEAGGRFTSLGGAPGIEHGSGLATNGQLHGRVMELVRD